jgi:hypothetical protein
MLVDRIVPFRFLLVVLIVVVETIVLGVIVQVKVCCGLASSNSQPFPRHKLLVMAGLDLCKDFMLVLTGSFVSPTLTVMLLQGQIPISMALSYCYAKCGDRAAILGYRSTHLIGACIITFSLLLAFIPVIVAWAHGSSDMATNTLIYFLSCVPASASVLYKEKSLTAYRQPLDPYVLNMQVDIYQLLLLIPLTPLAFKLQSFGFFGEGSDNLDDWGDDWSDDGTSVSAGSLQEGLLCFTAPHSTDPKSAPFLGHHGSLGPSPRHAYCEFALPLLLAYVGTSLLVNGAVDGVLRYGSTTLLYRSVTAATLTAYVVLGLLAHGEPKALFGLSVAILEIPSALLLVVGNELYHRYQEPGAEVLTQWTSPLPSV